MGKQSRTAIARRPTKASCYHTSILDIPFLDAKKMLEAHLLQRTTRTSEFTSWSSSLLVTLLDAMRKADFRHEGIVCLYVLNTRKLTKASVFPATMLLRAYGIKSEEELSQGMFNHGYLVHGAIDDESCFSIAGLQEVREHGLYDLFPELRAEQGKKPLSQRVDELRLKFFVHVWPMTMSEVGPLRDLAMCFGPKWVLPMTVAFLSLRLRHHRGRRYPQALLQELDGLQCPNGFLFNDYLFGTFYPPHDLLEVWQFACLLRRLCEAKYGDLLLRKDGDAQKELSGLIADPSGFRSSGLYMRDIDPESLFNRGAFDDDASSEEEGSFYEEELDWNMDDINGESFEGNGETWDPDVDAKEWDTKGPFMGKDD
ncbi:hypothetical protein MMC27_001506 [Xylographa pallens]|nr:hypothetical protein [Xylographa pallens]